MHELLTHKHIEDYQRDGVVLVKGLFADQVDLIRTGI
ncbi:MAG: phytanoyl-CoA dioxygenase, partial [Pseudomonadota bacterium]